MNRKGPALVLALILLWSGLAEGKSAKISHMSIQDNEGDLYLSFSITGAFTREIDELIHSGKEVVFIHRVEILRKRTIWFDRMVKKFNISCAVKYDNLTKKYDLKRTIGEEELEVKVTDLEIEMRKFMTHFEKLFLMERSDLPKTRKLVARVKSKLKNDFVFLFIPWDFNTNAEELRLP
jgi:hypothetical protein